MEHSSRPISPQAFDIALGEKPMTFWGLLRPFRGKMIGGALVLLLANMIAVTLPSLVNHGVGLLSGTPAKPLMFGFMTIELSTLTSLITYIVLLALIGAVIRTYSRVLIFDVGRLVERDVRARVLLHMSALDDKFFAANQVGDIMNHLTTDVSNVRMMTGFAVLSVLNISVIFIFSVPLLIAIHPYLAMAALLPFPLVMISTRLLTKRLFEATRNYQEHLSKLVNHVQENLGGAHIVRLFHQQEREGIRFQKTNRATFDASIKLARVRVLMFPMMRLIIGFAVALVLLVGGIMIQKGIIALGDLVETNARIMQLTWPAMAIGFVISIMSRGQASLSRLNKLLEARPNIIDGTDRLSSITTLDVHDLPLHKEGRVNIRLKQGEMLGIVGPSGSYKSTFLRMLYRRIHVPPGKIFYDQHDIVNIKLSSLSNHVGVVTQEPFLFNKSIKDNVTYLYPEASLDEIHKVLSIVRLDKDIGNFTEGLDTIIGERGITLSGGQKQRVALARALLAKRSVLILDDALSAVDAETEEHIIKNLTASLTNSMVIIATHRLSALKNANLTLVFDAGFVKDRGTHDQLLQTSTLYRELWGDFHD